MKPPILYIPLLLSLPVVLIVAYESTPIPPLQNANHIFNAIHASMRQFGSSIHHNGMSFFLASVPKDTKLYHGDASADPLKEIGWMAFEPEHAMVFARPSRRQRDKMTRIDMEDGTAQQHLLADDDDKEKLPSGVSGYLHTYAAAKDLRLLYVDGTSAGKSAIGTLDSQDRILFNETISRGVSSEDQRARTVCQLAKDEWQNRLDGVIRMAAGFEIILCEPEVNLVSVRVMPNGQERKDNGKEGKPGGKPAELLRAITSRYYGIGGERVKLNYDHFVTAYDPSYSLDLFADDDEMQSKRPRLRYHSSEELQPIRDNLTSLILDHEVTENSVNWQSIADLIVTKYGPILRSLLPPKPKDKNKHKPEDKQNPRHKPESTSKHDKQQQRKEHKQHKQQKNEPSTATRLSSLMSPFASSSPQETITLCATQFLSTPNADSPLAHQALYSINYNICSTLVELSTFLEMIEEGEDTKLVHSTVHDLIMYLNWSTWKECRGCRDNEFCAVPIWPQGSEKDFQHPRCRTFEDGWQGEGDYWGPIWD
ncbi:uncharacterized protein BDW70DRAFT_168637 [Aspergillus foveolatus]|uniref:uncharacterized protein n=1 Tax=Aspergillus foveolatus TaxID=210207 RepID=UPI003CCC9413